MKTMTKSFLNNLPPCWSKSLSDELIKPYMKELSLFLQDEVNNKKIYPTCSNILNSLKLSPIKDLKVVIIGQDPYHGENQANGLAFSVNKGIKIPPSLRNILKELNKDCNINRTSSDFTDLAQQGILFLNVSLTVLEKNPASHMKHWVVLTNNIIQDISNKILQLINDL